MLLDEHLVEGPCDPKWINEWAHAHGAQGDSGAIASFLGVIRADNVAEHQVESITYSAYRPLAEKILAGIEARLTEQHQLQGLRIWHSLGLVPVGHASMLVAVAAAHRRAAFDGLQAAVEAIKAEAPVWKWEGFAEGGRWVEGNKQTPKTTG